MGTDDHNAAGNLAIDGLVSHRGGSGNIPSRFMLQKPELSPGLMGVLAYMQTSPLPVNDMYVLHDHMLRRNYWLLTQEIKRETKAFRTDTR